MNINEVMEQLPQTDAQQAGESVSSVFIEHERSLRQDLAPVQCWKRKQLDVEPVKNILEAGW